MREGLAQGLYVAARVGFEPVTFCTEGTEHHHWATTPHGLCGKNEGVQVVRKVGQKSPPSTCV